MEFSNQVDVVSLGIINELVQPDDVGVLQSLKYLKLFLDAIISIPPVAKWFTLECFPVHLFDCVLGICVGIQTKVHRCKGSSPQLLLKQVLVYLLTLLLLYLLDLCGANHR